MSKPWRYQQTQDKLRIFVSSRIQECKDERSIVREAIRSLSHEPVLFEHLGARTYSPRDLYLSYLHDSQVMVMYPDDIRHSFLIKPKRRSRHEKTTALHPGVSI
jgi:hypothetical protein